MYPKMKYTKVAEGNLEEEIESLPRFLLASHQRSFYPFLVVSVLALVASNAFTWFYATTPCQPVQVSVEAHSKYAGLAFDTDAFLDGHSPWTSSNTTIRDKLWLDINVDDGMIALDNKDVERWALPTSQPFPWDTSKSIYLLQGHHNLHCARSIYISLMEYREGHPQSRSHHHIIHCLDALRRDVICNADDTPRFTTSTDAPETGHGQHRQCRSWDALNDWARRHYACYRYSHEDLGSSYPEVQRFVWCPEGSPYRKEVDKYFVVDYDEPRGEGII